MIRPKYGAIQAVRDICDPWIRLWGGAEWGDSMNNLHGAAHTDYGLSDADCATVAEILLRNVIDMREFMEEEGRSYGIFDDVDEADAKSEATESRDYWLKGGNLGDWYTTIEDAKSSIDQMPTWMFKEEE